MKKGLLTLAILAITLVGCKKEEKVVVDATGTDTLVVDETSTVIDDTVTVDTDAATATTTGWQGKYIGQIPCVSCDGIVATLELRNDMTYTASSMFTERDKKPIDFDGKFTWLEKEKTLQLDAAGDKRKFEVVNGGIVPLDRDGKRFPSTKGTDIPDNGEYFLKKQ